MWSQGLLSVLAMVAVLTVAACTPAAPPAEPAAKPPQPPAAKPAEQQPAKPAPAAKPAEKQVAQLAPEPWEQEWEQVLAAARQEGTVGVTGPHGVEARDALTEPFTRQYGIEVEFFGAPQPQITPRVVTERGAGQYLWDVYVGGTTASFAFPEGTFDPLEPALILPDVRDPSTWREGELPFVDEGRILASTLYHAGRIAVNPDLVRPDTFSSFKDLLHADWKGKIVSHDPRASGPGQATFLFFYLHPELGPDFIRQLAEQELLLVSDIGQSLDLVARGTYPILLGPSDSRAEALTMQGVPLEMIDPRQFRELSDVTPANGGIGLYNRAPNPNAAKIYINWLLSGDGQTEFVRAQGSISQRLDVPTDHTLTWKVPAPGALKTYTKEARDAAQEELVPLLIELLGER